MVSDFWQQFILSDSHDNPDGANICSGDSGGPQFLVTEGRLIEWAVHSWGDANCTSRSGSTRVDEAQEYDWIIEQVEAIHGVADLCEINGFYGDGWCDDDCPSVDADCLPPVEPMDEDEDEPSAEGDGCSGCAGGTVAWLIAVGGPLGLLPLRRARRTEGGGRGAAAAVQGP